MKRLLALAAVSLLVSTGGAYAQGKMGKTKTASGTVKSVSNDSLTVTRGTQEWTFAVDHTTKIIAKGASTKTAEKKELGQKLVITDVVKENRRVTVKYHDMDGKLHAAEIRVM